MSGWKNENIINQPIKEISLCKINKLLKLKKSLKKETDLLRKGKGFVAKQQRFYKLIRDMGANLVP